MGKPTIKPNPRVTEIFNDLARFLDFCVEYGYKYNEADLYNFKSYAWQQYSKYQQGKAAKNLWREDARRFSGQRA